MKVVLTVDEESRKIVLAVDYDDSGDLQSLELFPNEAEAIGWGLISASERSRALWAAARTAEADPAADIAPAPGEPSAN